MLDFRIFTFLEVCKQMNFTKAAKKLNITQPAVSQHIRWLEKEYGIKLFEMEGKKLPRSIRRLDLAISIRAMAESTE